MILASQSPRREQLLRLITDDFIVKTAAVDERAVRCKDPFNLARILAQIKAEAVFAQYPEEVVIGCDTVVDLDGCCLGKPHNKEEAIEMLTHLAGRTHAVHTGVCICMRKNGLPQTMVLGETTQVTFSPISKQEIVEYVEKGDCFDKAGGYGIQGEMARFIPKIQGCYYNVMGLPVAALYHALRALGILSL